MIISVPNQDKFSREEKANIKCVKALAREMVGRALEIIGVSSKDITIEIVRDGRFTETLDAVYTIVSREKTGVYKYVIRLNDILIMRDKAVYYKLCKG